MPALYLVYYLPNWENDKMHTAPKKLSIHCPAKINLNLAVTGQRADGFHELVSLVAPLEFGDELEVIWRPDGQTGKAELECDDPELAVDERNLVIRAIRAYREVHAFTGSLQCRLTKVIPAGAGLGGGSSDAAGLLLALNQLLGSPLGDTELCGVAATIGSDCPLFFAQKPVIMRGRGEALEALSPRAVKVLAGQSVLLFKPPFGIATPWAFSMMRAAPDGCFYADSKAFEARLRSWLDAPDWASLPLLNSLQSVVEQKYLAIGLMVRRLQADFGLRSQMSGSGSSCFVLLDGSDQAAEIEHFIRRNWGPAAWIQQTSIKEKCSDDLSC